MDERAIAEKAAAQRASALEEILRRHMKPSFPDPTYREMLHPRVAAGGNPQPALAAPPMSWTPSTSSTSPGAAPDSQIRHVVLPKELTGVEANIVVLVGRHFPSGSHKVGPAYCHAHGRRTRGRNRSPARTPSSAPPPAISASASAYISRLKGYPAIVIMPEGMSAERYQRIRQYGGQLDLTPGSESDVILVLERTEEYKKDPRNKILAQFELLPNYRFHRYVTGRSALEAAAELRQRPRGRFRFRARIGRNAGRRRRDQGALSRTPWSARWSRRSAPRCSTTAAARTASKASATRW